MGRSALIMVLGFTTALLMIGSNITKVSSAGMENYTAYNNNAMAHAIAGAGINLASRAIFENRLWRSGFSNKSFGGGQFTVTVEDVGYNRVKMTSISTFAGISRVVACLLQPSSFSRYNYYSVTDQNGYWVGGDTIWGPFHCNNTLNVANTNGGSPVFMQRVTSLNGIKNYNNAHPVFKGGYNSGVNVDLPGVNGFDTLKHAAQTAGKWLWGYGSPPVFVKFNSDGTVTWRIGGSTDWSGEGWTTEPLTSFAPNGAVWCNENNLHIKGVLNGRVTVGGTHDIWIDGDLTYAADPRVGYSDDLLGLCADNKLLISDVPENRGPNNNFTLMGSIFSRLDGLWAENYSTRPVEGKMTTVGGMVQRIGGYTGTFSGSSITHGFLPGGTYYDDRLMDDSPPFFPTTGNFEVVSWFE
ncbi:MAG: hypothetical protein NTZ35_09475 [Ignavibacteriales bacterium]|nr:hypothetical protein [Ignavibacteriales bacterium]